MIRRVFILVLALAANCAAADVARADSIVLRSSARASPPVALRDVATLEGPDALALADCIVFEPAAESRISRTELSIEDVRVALDASKPGIRWGRIALSGDSCSVRLVVERTETVPEISVSEPAPAPALRQPQGPAWHVVSDMKEQTLRSAIGARLASFLKAEPADVRIAFSEAETALLETPAAGRTLDIQPTGLGAIVPVLVRVFESDRVVAAGTANVRIEQKLSVVGATKSLHRGDAVTKEVIFSESRWVVPGQRLAAEAAVLGSVVKNRLQPGELILESDIEPAILVKRGDIVNIACLAGSIVMNTKARALTNGRENEVIEFSPLRNVKSKVSARVIAPGQAVINADTGGDQVYQAGSPQPAAPEKPLSATEARPSPPAGTTSATSGAVTVQRVTNKADGTFIVEASTTDPKKPVRKMKFMPLDEP